LFSTYTKLMMKKIKITKRRLLITTLTISILTGGASYLINHHIDTAYNHKIYTKPSLTPYNKVALLLGTSKTVSGRGNLYFITRVDAVAKLYHAKRISKIVASGDNSSKGYDEATDMEEALIKKGVKAEDIYLDYAGFRTLDSVVRLKKIFNIKKVTIVTQKTHCQRAIFIAENHGINAIGFAAQDIIHLGKIRLQIREYLARVKAWIDVKIINKSPKFLGEKVNIT